MFICIYRRRITTSDQDKYFTTGCSGAIVFLLEGADAGRCLGVQVRSPLVEPAINVAFKIHEAPTLD